MFQFTVEARAGTNPPVRKTYTLTVAEPGEELPPRSTVDTLPSPLDGGTTSGDGSYTNDTTATVTATPAAGFAFVDWRDNGKVVSRSATYTFTNIVNRSLVASFIPAPTLAHVFTAPSTLTLSWSTNFASWKLQESCRPQLRNLDEFPPASPDCRRPETSDDLAADRTRLLSADWSLNPCRQPENAKPGFMKTAILADIHANLEAIQSVLADARAQGCTQFCCAGDLVGYGANPKECVDLVRSMNMHCVKGDLDELCSTDDELTGFSPHTAAAILWTRRQLTPEHRGWLHELKYVTIIGNFSLVHATLDGPHRWGYVFDKLAAAASFTYQNTQICFFGHTHVPVAFIRDTVVRGGTYSKFKSSPHVNTSSASPASVGPATVIPRLATRFTTPNRPPSKSVAWTTTSYRPKEIITAGLPSALADGLSVGHSYEELSGPRHLPSASAPATITPPLHAPQKYPNLWSKFWNWLARHRSGNRGLGNNIFIL